jgi:hypothetical protein
MYQSDQGSHRLIYQELRAQPSEKKVQARLGVSWFCKLLYVSYLGNARKRKMRIIVTMSCSSRGRAIAYGCLIRGRKLVGRLWSIYMRGDAKYGGSGIK